MKRWKGNINISWRIRTEYTWQTECKSSSTEIPKNGWQNCIMVFHGALYISQDQDSTERRLKFQRIDNKIVLWSFTEFSSMQTPNCFRWPRKWGQNEICDEEQSRGKRKSETVSEFHFCLSSDYKVQVMPPWCSCNRHIDRHVIEMSKSTYFLTYQQVHLLGRIYIQSKYKCRKVEMRGSYLWWNWLSNSNWFLWQWNLWQEILTVIGGLGLNTRDRKGVNPHRLKFQRMDDKIVLWSFMEFCTFLKIKTQEPID